MELKQIDAKSITDNWVTPLKHKGKRYLSFPSTHSKKKNFKWNFLLIFNLKFDVSVLELVITTVEIYLVMPEVIGRDLKWKIEILGFAQVRLLNLVRGQWILRKIDAIFIPMGNVKGIKFLSISIASLVLVILCPMSSTKKSSNYIRNGELDKIKSVMGYLQNFLTP